MDRSARAFWLASPGLGEIRDTELPEPAEGDVLVRTLFSGVSRGTETLVFRGGVPESQHSAMRAPFQEGDFPGPVKYGYLNVGVVEEGPPDLLGRTVFCLYPHQTRYVVPASAVTPVPETVPASRAVLAGTVETAVNALWDAAPLIGDRITVVGAGMVGASVAALLARYPAARVQLVDANPARADIAEALGVDFALPADADRRPRPRRPRQRHRGGARPLAGTPRPGGHRPRTELVRRPLGQPPARRGLPLPPPDHTQQSGRLRLPGQKRPPNVRRPPGHRPRPPRRPGLRRSDHRRVLLRGATGDDGRARCGGIDGDVPSRPLRRDRTRTLMDKGHRPRLQGRGAVSTCGFARAGSPPSWARQAPANPQSPTHPHPHRTQLPLPAERTVRNSDPNPLNTENGPAVLHGTPRQRGQTHRTWRVVRCSASPSAIT